MCALWYDRRGENGLPFTLCQDALRWVSADPVARLPALLTVRALTIHDCGVAVHELTYEPKPDAAEAP